MQVQAKLKLAIAVCIGGTDYNANIPGKSFGTSRQKVSQIKGHFQPDILMTNVRSSSFCSYSLVRILNLLLMIFLNFQVLKEMDISEARWRPFFLAMYQFIFPAIGTCDDGSWIRPGDPATILSEFDPSIFEELDTPVETTNTSKLTTSTEASSARYKAVDVVRPPLPAEIQPPRQRKHKRENMKILKPSATRKKRTLATAKDDGRKGDEPAKKKRKINPEGKTVYFKGLRRNRKYLASVSNNYNSSCVSSSIFSELISLSRPHPYNASWSLLFSSLCCNKAMFR